jgi:predicted ArsR family transcriptional regulator
MDPAAPSRPSSDLDQLGALAEPVRRRLYAVVSAAGEPVDRDQAAAGADVSRALAAFHLDRLVDAGLLETEYRRRSGRSGPGAGRPAKFYRRPSDRDVSVSLPPRHYDLAARILAEGIEHDPAAPPQVLDAARREGERLAAGAASTGNRGGVLALLVDQGYEPAEEADGSVTLRNCPFHALVGDHRDLTCGMNHALLRGVLDGAGDAGLVPVADPAEGRCCVRLVPADVATPTDPEESPRRASAG